ncbi:MAG: 50S ribosomal protein L24, partial [archaeon]
MTSRKPSKQRKGMYEKPLHKRHEDFNAPLSKELREKYKIKHINVRKGDIVKIKSGKMKGKQGKVIKVDLKKYRIFVEGLTIKKKNGKETFVPIHPSKVIIQE